MMSQESQHLHHHHRLNDFSVIVGTPSTATAKLGTGGNELLGMEIQSPNWASFVPEGAKFLLPAQELLNEFCSLGGSGHGSVKKEDL
ncbi:hypothetical protein HPP92_005034 [Vanilla planifolia]|uniref:Uncharacterized protein n=1 Tax=Vanilla planifolia TaxID=51239 RepID=A0A835RT98_VANPL|nr:hypothetical protein HPP92_005034 [Vanilla planifolia]